MNTRIPFINRGLGVIVAFSVIALVLSGCSKQTVEVTAEKLKTVQVIEIKENTLPVKLNYLGMIGTGELKKYSFKVPGKLANITVSKGEKVKKGQRLAELTKTELNYALDAAELSAQKAKLAYDDANNNYEKLKKLNEAGAISNSDLEKAKLNLEVRQADYNQALIDVNSKKTMVSDSVIYSDMDGYVVDVMYKVGEIVPQGYPIVVVRTEDQIINVGISQQDIKKIIQGTAAIVTIDKYEASGEVIKIDQVPDAQTRTYNTEIKLTKKFPVEANYLGSTTKIAIELGGEKGIWIPISSILSDGEDYVYVVQNDRAVKKNVKLLNVQGFNVRVEGLMVGEKLVTVGMKELKEGAKISIQEKAGTN